jgi:hypothetical protein
MTPISNKTRAQQKADKAIKRCRIDPAFWVELTFGDAIKLSNQQKDACDLLGKIIWSKLAISVGRTLEREQKRCSEVIGMAISSGMGLGKDFWLGLMILYFLDVFPIEKGQAPRVLATANTSKQLKNVLWTQISQFPAMSKSLPDSDKTILEEKFECQSEKIYRKELKGKSFFAEAVTIPPHAASDEQAKALTGRHAPYMLMAIDEAAGMPNPVFENLEGTLTGRVNLIIMIFNPIKSRGFAIEACEKPDRWVYLNWNGEDTRFDDPSMDVPLQNNIRGLLKQYGRNSNAYRIRVLGLPPIMGADTFFDWDTIQDSIEKELDPTPDDVTVMGVDPAVGGDNCAIVVRIGQKIVYIRRFTESDTMRFAEIVAEEARIWDPWSINVDNIGVGQGVADRLRQLHFPAYDADVRRKARDRLNYKLVRDELWQTLKLKFEKGQISLPVDQRLQDQLGSITIKDYAATGKMNVPTKAQMKKDIGYSPDEADAICLTYAIPDDILVQEREYKENEPYDDEEEEELIRCPDTGY